MTHLVIMSPWMRRNVTGGVQGTQLRSAEGHGGSLCGVTVSIVTDTELLIFTTSGITKVMLKTNPRCIILVHTVQGRILLQISRPTLLLRETCRMSVKNLF